MISNKRSPNFTFISSRFYYDSSVISHHPVVQYLSVLIDSKLNWNEYCKYISAKGTRSLNFLPPMLLHQLILLLTGACLPCARVCLSCWHPHTAKNINVLESVQSFPLGFQQQVDCAVHSIDGASLLMSAYKS